MKHAVIETGGKQYRVAEGDIVFMEKIDSEEGTAVTFGNVLAVIDGDTAVFGTPTVKNATVSAEVVKTGKSKKIRVFKKNPKKGYQKTMGHRQPYTKVKINAINS